MRVGLVDIVELSPSQATDVIGAGLRSLAVEAVESGIGTGLPEIRKCRAMGVQRLDLAILVSLSRDAVDFREGGSSYAD